MGPHRGVWPASQAEMCPFHTPQLDAVFVSQASACQAWAFCLAGTWGWGKRCVAKYQTIFHMVALNCLEVGRDRARIWPEFLHGPKLVLHIQVVQSVWNIASEKA